MRPRVDPTDRAVIAKRAWRLGSLAVRINCCFAGKNALAEIAQPRLNRIQEREELLRLHRVSGPVAKGSVLLPRVLELLAVLCRVQKIEGRDVEVPGMPIRLPPCRVTVGQYVVALCTTFISTAQADIKDSRRFQSRHPETGEWILHPPEHVKVRGQLHLHAVMKKDCVDFARR